MFIDQISVFLENKPGQLASVIRLFADNKINLEAMCLSETDSYGILHAIVGRPDLALSLLKDSGFTCKKTNVLTVSVSDEPGALTNIMSILAAENVNIAYTYAFLSREQGRARIVLRVKDNEAVAALLKKNGIAD